jgi:hypothetical protein
MQISEALLVRAEIDFLKNNIMSEETWTYGYDTETKCKLSQWKSPSSLRLKKARQVK